jgi:transcriptional regulator with XRE-family HTH domain
MDMKKLGIRIAQLRGAETDSLGTIAEKAGIAKSYLAKIERGEVENPGLRTLVSIASALEITITDLLRPVAIKSRSTEQGSRELRQAMTELLRQDMPASLVDFIDQREKDGDPIPPNLQQSLALLHLRGKRPQRKEDWSYLYETLRRAIQSSR